MMNSKLKKRQLAFKQSLDARGIPNTLLGDNYIFVEGIEEHKAEIRQLCRQHNVTSLSKIKRNGIPVWRVRLQESNDEPYVDSNTDTAQQNAVDSNESNLVDDQTKHFMTYKPFVIQTAD